MFRELSLILAGWTPLNSLYCITPTELFWYLYNIFFILVRNFFFFSYKGSKIFYTFALHNSLFFYASFFYIFVLFLILSAFTRKPRTKKILMVSYYLTILFFISWFFLLNWSEINPQISEKYNTGYWFFSMRFSFYKQCTPFILLIIWILVVYKADFKSPLLGSKVPFNSWFFFFAPFLFFLWSTTKSLAIMFVVSEFIVYFLFSSDVFKLKRYSITKLHLIRPLLIIFFVLKDFLVLDSFYFTSFVDYSINLLLFLWFLFWMFYIDRYISNRHPASSFFFIGFVKPWLLLSFSTLCIPNLFSFLLTPYFFYFLFFLTPQTLRLVQAIPSKAFERGRKITMFEAAPPLVLPEPLIEHLYYNSNLFKFVYVVFNYSTYTLFFFLMVFKVNFYDFFYILLILQSVIIFLVFYSGATIVKTLKTSDILDLRGMFLAVHQYHWCTKYTFIVLVFFTFTFLLLFFTFAFLYLTSTVFSFSTFAMGCICFFFFFHLFERLLTTWGNIITYFQFADFDTWNDVFWTYLSPFLKDVVFWTPIQPDDYEEPRPYYFQFARKVSARYLLFCYIVFFVFSFFLFSNMFVLFNFVYFFLFYKFLFIYVIFYTYKEIFNFDISNDQLFLSDFTYFEFITYLAYGVGLFLIIYIYFWYDDIVAFLSYLPTLL